MDNISLLDVASYLDSGDLAKLDSAITFARDVYGKKKFTYSPQYYFHHPLRVATILAQWQAPLDVLIAGLLHDTYKTRFVTDSSHQLSSKIRKYFGRKVERLIKDVNLLSNLKEFDNKEDDEENWNEINLILRNNWEGVVIKIADRIDYLRYIHEIKSEIELQHGKRFIDKYFIQLANNLGLWIAVRELENYLFKVMNQELFYAYFKRYQLEIKDPDFISAKETLLRETKRNVNSIIIQEMEFSWFKRRNKNNLGPPLILLCETVDDCYLALATVHSIYQPVSYVEGGFRDYIGHPKTNGYKSIHSYVRIKPGRVIRVILRTKLMHIVSEYGAAAKWHGVNPEYLPRIIEKPTPPPGKIVVFTPSGDHKFLDGGATVLDFMYKIHKDLAYNAISALINGTDIVGFDYVLQTGDTVRILRAEGELSLNENWLKIAKCASTKTAIRRQLKRIRTTDELNSLGKKILIERLKERNQLSGLSTLIDNLDQLLHKIGYDSKGMLELYSGIALGTKSPDNVAQQIELQVISGETLPWGVKIIGAHDLREPIRFCSKCKPSFEDEIVGYYIRGKQITVHKRNCGYIRKNGVLFRAQWVPPTLVGSARITLNMYDKKGIIKKIGEILYSSNVIITKFSAESSVDSGLAKIHIELINSRQTEINKLTEQLKQIGIIKSIKTLDLSQHSQSEIISNIKSPFTEKPVFGEKFFGRSKDLNNILSHMRSNSQDVNSIVLLGPRRIGKTSLLKETKLRLELNGSFLVAYIDLQELSSKRADVLSLKIYNAIVSEANRHHYNLTHITDEASDFSIASFERIINKIKTPIVVMLDEIEIVSSLADAESITVSQLLTYFRSIIQHNKMVFIFSAAGSMRIFRERTPSLINAFNVVKNIRIEQMTLIDARDIITKSVENIYFDEDATNLILKKTNGHPFYIQLICDTVIYELKERKVTTATIEIVKSAIDSFINYISNDQHYSFLWGDQIGLSIQQMNLLEHVLALVALLSSNEKRWVSVSEILDALINNFKYGYQLDPILLESALLKSFKILTEIGTLEKDVHKRKYRIKFPIVEDWLKSSYNIKLAFEEVLKYAS